jgi:hypothetical protein
MRSVSSREKAFALLFLLALAWGAWNYRPWFLGKPQAETLQGSAPESALALSNPQEPPVPLAAASGDTSRALLPDWGDDPFNRPWRGAGSAPSSVTASSKVRKQALWLTAIVVRPDRRYAVINGKIVKEGQEVAGRQVTRIEASRVLVDDNGVEVTLTL